MKCATCSAPPEDRAEKEWALEARKDGEQGYKDPSLGNEETPGLSVETT